MKKLLILGGGTAGTLILNKLFKKLDRTAWSFTIVDKDELHYYQPGFLFIPFEIYAREQVIRHKRDFFPQGVEVVIAEVDRIVPEENRVLLTDGQVLDYDVLIVATGTTPRPEETPGLSGPHWYRRIFDFYTYEGACKLADFLKTWTGGRLVINIAESVIKCPVAPLEFAFLADAYFTEKGHRFQLRHRAVARNVSPARRRADDPVGRDAPESLREAVLRVGVLAHAVDRQADSGADMEKIPTMVAGLPGFDALASSLMRKEMDKLDIPPVSEFLEMIVAGGGKLYGCKLAIDMFKLQREDLVDDLEDIITVGDFYNLAGGDRTHLIFV